MTKPFEDITYTNHTLNHIKTFPAPRWSRPPVNKTTITRQNVEPPPMAMPESNLKRAVNYLADYSGCGMWRLGAAEYLFVADVKIFQQFPPPRADAGRAVTAIVAINDGKVVSKVLAVHHVCGAQLFHI